MTVTTEAQMIALVRAPDITAPEGLRDRAALAVLCACGLRASEICGLRVRDVGPDLVFVRAGKELPVTCTEVIAQFRQPPAVYSPTQPPPNYLRFRISPDVQIALGVMVKVPGR